MSSPSPTAPPPHNAPADQAAPVASTRVLRQFRILFNAVKTHFRQVERDAGVGGAQLWALSEITARPGLGVSELARAMDIHQSTASNMVKGLIERGLIVAERKGGDRRVVALRVVEQGASILRAAPAPFAGVLPDALGALDAATLERLERDLATLVALLKTDEDSANTPLADL